jgi:hypothetical protein
MLLIGSTAIKHHFPDFPREPKDIDYATTEKRDNQKGIEYLYNPIIGDMEGIASPDILYTLKVSHIIGWDIKWDKHMFDIQFLKKKGCKIDKELFERLYNFWNSHHGLNKRSNLDMSAEDFFNNALKTPHDHYHNLLNPVPVYTKILKDGSEVDVSEVKFNLLTNEEKYDLVREEVMVMAYERFRKTRNYMVAYTKMLTKFITTHAPIWEALFIIENYVPLHKPLFNYYKTIDNGININ